MACHGRTAGFPSFIVPKLSRRSGFEAVKAQQTNFSESNEKKMANLSATRKERIKIPDYDDGYGGKAYHISEFLSHPLGIQAMLNTSALQSFQPLDSNTYRCTLPSIQLLNLEVAPVMDLQVTPTTEDCTIEMLSCKFEGSEVVEHQNNHFVASMRNYLTWDTRDSQLCLNIDVKLKLSLEIYSPPFTMLPISAVEGPGNL